MPRHSSADVNSIHRSQLIALWMEHAPKKVAKVDTLLAKHIGEEDAFVAKQFAKYGVAAGMAPIVRSPAPAPSALPAAIAEEAQVEAGIETMIETEAATEADAALEAEAEDEVEAAAEAEANAAILEAPAETSADATDAAAETAQGHHDELTALYAQYAPHKLVTVDKMLTKYAGKEHKMLAALRSKYEKKKAEEARGADAAKAEDSVAATAQGAIAEDDDAPCDALERAQMLMESEEAAKAETPKRKSRPAMFTRPSVSSVFKKRPSANKASPAAAGSAGAARSSDARSNTSSSSPSRASTGAPERDASGRGTTGRGAVGRSPPGMRSPPGGSTRAAGRGPPGTRKPGHTPRTARAARARPLEET